MEYIDQQALFSKFLDLLQSEATAPEYLGEEPESINQFDPYQMVAEWIALRHEVKQQGKLLQAAQNTLQQSLEEGETKNAQLQKYWQESQQQSLLQVEREHKKLLLDLLGVVDALDQADAHWQEQIEALKSSQPQPFWKKWLEQLTQPDQNDISESSSSINDILVSNQQGIALIRRSLLDVLRQRQVIPIESKGHPFDPEKMYALGRQESDSFPENTVLQEVVRGYRWGDQVLREAQVIVALPKKGKED